MLSSKLEDEKLVIYRDWRIYFPPNDNWRVEMNWDMGSYDYINDLNPDLILLETENVQLFADPDTIHKAVEPDEMRVLNAFYGDAARDELPGYKLLYRDGFGYVLLRDVLYEKILCTINPLACFIRDNNNKRHPLPGCLLLLLNIRSNATDSSVLLPGHFPTCELFCYAALLLLCH